MPRPIIKNNNPQPNEPDKEVETIKSEDVGKVPESVAATETKQPQVKNPRVTELYKQLQEEKEALEKELQPYRELYEKHVNDPKYIEARAKIKELNAKLGPIHNELASIARAGGAKGIKIEAGEISMESK